MDYADYLRLDRLLSAQQPLSDAPDEPIFIVTHQVSELWMKLLLKELGEARSAIAGDRLGFAFRGFARASRILEQMSRMWDVLSTMTPADYLAFRDALGTSSGFQSLQYRLIEFLLGARDRGYLAAHRHRPEAVAALEAELARRSLYGETLALLVRRGFELPVGTADAALDCHPQTIPAVEAAWARIYADTPAHWELYDLAEKLVDIEHKVQLWRFAHLKTVERIIGHRRGTGGTTGVAYLAEAVERGFFPELLAVRTSL
jgi:tryptophan 2,3-dioxygenase